MTPLCLLPLASRLLGLPFLRRALQVSTLQGLICSRVTTLGAKAVCTERTVPGEVLSADPEAPCYGEGQYRERVGGSVQAQKTRGIYRYFPTLFIQQDEPGKLIPRYVLHSWQSSAIITIALMTFQIYLHKECLPSVRLKYLPLNVTLIFSSSFSFFPFFGKILIPTLWVGISAKKKDFTWLTQWLKKLKNS